MTRLIPVETDTDAVWSALDKADSTNTTASALSTVNLVCAADLKPEPIRWLWPGWLPRGKLTILAGDGGTGKTTLAVNIAATITTAGRWPDQTHCADAGNVIVWSSEDDPRDTLTPRFIAAGADLRKVHFIQGAQNSEGESVPFDPASNIGLLLRAIDDIGGVDLLIIDPVISTVSGDMHKANDVRRSLQPIVDLAAAKGCAVLGISHYAKGSKGSSPTERVIGSQAFAALARMVLVTAKKEGSNERVLARAKSNISADTGGFGYMIEPLIVADGIETTVCRWGDEVIGTARKILDDVETSELEQERSTLDDAKNFLITELETGPRLVSEIQDDAKAAGYSIATIRRARAALGIDSYKVGMSKGWVWELPAPPKVLIKTRRCSTSQDEHLREMVSTFGET